MYITSDFMAGWLRGFFDGEGSARFRDGYIRKNGKPHTTYCLTVSNTNDVLMDTCREYLHSLGIGFTELGVRYRPNRRPCRTIHIAKGHSIVRFHDLVGFASPEKQNILETIIAWINRIGIDEQRLPLVAELWNQGHSLRCIGLTLGLRPGHHNKFRKVLVNNGFPVPPFGKGRKRCMCHH